MAEGRAITKSMDVFLTGLSPSSEEQAARLTIIRADGRRSLARVLSQTELQLLIEKAIDIQELH